MHITQCQSTRAQEIPSIQISRCDVRVSVSAIRPVIGTSSIHQTTEISNFDSQILRNKSGDLPGRPTDSSPKHSRAAEDIPTSN